VIKNPVWILAVAFIATNVFLGLRSTNWSFIDENTYIHATIAIISGQSCPITSLTLSTPTICNYEHPPLVKLLEAASLSVFGWAVPKSAYPHVMVVTLGNTSAGGILTSISYPSQILGTISTSPLWFLSFRFFQLIMGALSLPLIYVIALRISGNQRLALLSSLLLFLDPLYAFFSRTAYLDVPMIFFALCAYAVYSCSFRLGPVNKFWLTGAMLGLSALSKESGIVFIFPLMFYHIAFGQTDRRTSRVREILSIIAGEVILTAIGLQIYDVLARTPFPTFLNQVEYIMSFSASFRCAEPCSLGATPFSWFTSLFPNKWAVGLSDNPTLLLLVCVWMPVGLYLYWKSDRKQTPPENRLFVFAALLFGSVFSEDLLFYVGGRIDWIWYSLTMVPALALGGAYLLTREGLPRWMVKALVSLLLVGYISAYLAGPNLLKFD
jgi:predicted membrane-bound dolichyl-phosphate-mannose-protein mannosyltransferase